MYLYIGTHIYFQYHKSHSIYFQYHQKLLNLLQISQKLSMDPFPIEAYKQKRDIEDTYIVNRFFSVEKK